MEKYALALEFPPEEIKTIKEESSIFSTASTESTSSGKEETSAKSGTVINLPPSAFHERKTLFLDLDETLIKVSNDSSIQPDFSFLLHSSSHNVYKRNGLDQFL